MDKNGRVATLRHFSIYYKVYEEKIIITAFWDNRQDPKRILEILENNLQDKSFDNKKLD